jgi:hypothetical protein
MHANKNGLQEAEATTQLMRRSLEFELTLHLTVQQFVIGCQVL